MNLFEVKEKTIKIPVRCFLVHNSSFTLSGHDVGFCFCLFSTILYLRVLSEAVFSILSIFAMQ